MKKLYCVICGKYRKFEKPKISYLLEKTLVLSIVCSKCKNEDEKIFKEEEVRNSRVMKLSYETELCKMTSHFDLLTRNFLYKSFF